MMNNDRKSATESIIIMMLKAGIVPAFFVCIYLKAISTGPECSSKVEMTGFLSNPGLYITAQIRMPWL